uniref:Spindle assembly abnormal protein 6 homolog n=1 Tax=Nicotiana tabacum TaxID=4097 RepID=A0A1S4B460_TOBAC|nr:PREDICTED: spindle assembly abnormal protein 6 homolog [Nicotiana tabacum]
MKRTFSSLSSEKKQTRRRPVRKSKENTSARAPTLDSLYQLRDESEEEEPFYSGLVLHHENFLWYRDEMNQLEAEVIELTEKRDIYKLLSEHREGEANSLRVELEATRKEHANLVEQVQQKIDRIYQLRAEMDAVKVKVEDWRGRMDHRASKKETARAQLTLAEAQLRATREKSEARSKNIEDLQSQLSSVVDDRETLAKELKAAKSVVEVTKDDADEMVAQYKDDADADAMVAQYKVDAEVAQGHLKDIVEYMKWQSRREALEEVHDQGFDLSAEIESAKGLEAEAKKLAYSEDKEDSEGSSESGSGEDSDGPSDQAGSSGDQAV